MRYVFAPALISIGIVRARLPAPGRFDSHGGWRMDLVGGEQMRIGHPERRRHAATVLRDLGGLVARADPAVEARIDAVRNPARAREKAVADAVER